MRSQQEDRVLWGILKWFLIVSFGGFMAMSAVSLIFDKPML